MAGKVENKNERNMKMRTITCSETSGKRELGAMVRTDNFVNVNVFKSVTNISSCTLLPLHFALFHNNAGGL